MRVVYFLIPLVVFSLPLFGATPVSLETKLEQLKVPDNQAPSGVAGEKLYAVQTRYTPLRKRFEVSLGGAKNFSTNGYVVSHELDLGARYYLTDRWFVGMNGSAVFNKFSALSNAIIANNSVGPDVSYTKFRGEALGGFNLFYGKFRLSMDSVFYFDQYVSIGPGVVVLDSGTKLAAVGDIGLVLWMGKQASLRLGVKDYFFKEQRVRSSSHVHHLLGHLQFGYLFL